MDLRERPKGQARRHPWETTRLAFFSRLARRHLPASGFVSALDVGAGDTWFAQEFLAQGPPVTRIVVWDEGYDEGTLRALQVSAPPGIAFRRSRPSERFGLVFLLDVLEHIEDDVGFLATLVRENLDTGGIAVISVPAWPALYARHDRGLRHFRRYAPRDARRLVAASGLEILRSGGLYHGLLPLRAAAVASERMGGKREDGGEIEALIWRHGEVAARIVETLLRADQTISRLASGIGVDLPGLSWWAVCRKST